MSVKRIYSMTGYWR